MNAVVRQESALDPQGQDAIEIHMEASRRGAVYRLDGCAPTTQERLAALGQVLGQAAELEFRSVILSWYCKRPFNSDFIEPAVALLVKADDRSMRMGLVSHYVADDRLLETLAIECIVCGLNVQHFQDIGRAARWARFL